MGWPHNAYVGQKVVCVNDSYPLNPSVIISYPNLPKLNFIYTIAELRNEKSIVLKELDNSDIITGRQNGFFISRFRPVQSTEKGMKILRGLLNPKNHKKIVEPAITLKDYEREILRPLVKKYGY